VLKDVSLVAEPGQVVALVGPTGAGKTTVASLLLRFIEPGAGRITVGGRDMAAIDRATWRREVAWVPQLPYLFHGSVADNIRLARPEAEMAEVIEAARASHADEFIRRLPHGYETVLGEQGAGLSGGQARRLAIARAFLKDAPILILDEATANLDARSEALIADSLTRLMTGRTVLIIAHRLDVTRSADQVAVMEDGRVVESGTPETLLAAEGLYARLVAAQSAQT
jgi:ATP-binding cassette subfamily C protein CydD